jgi:ABC-type dipeptide/oligopeptide/nickel transport system permease component
MLVFGVTYVLAFVVCIAFGIVGALEEHGTVTVGDLGLIVTVSMFPFFNIVFAIVLTFQYLSNAKWFNDFCATEVITKEKK